MPVLEPRRSWLKRQQEGEGQAARDWMYGTLLLIEVVVRIVLYALVFLEARAVAGEQEEGQRTVHDLGQNISM